MQKTILFILTCSLVLSCSTKQEKRLAVESEVKKDSTIQKQIIPDSAVDIDTIETIKEKTLAEFLNTFEKFETKRVYEENGGLHLIDELYQLVDFTQKDDNISIFRGELINDDRRIFFVKEEYSNHFVFLFDNHNNIQVLESSYSKDYWILSNHSVYHADNKTYLGIEYGGSFTGEMVYWMNIHDITSSSRYCLSITKTLYSNSGYYSDEQKWKEWDTNINIKEDSVYIRQNITIGNEHKCTKYNTFSLLDSTLRNITLNANCPY